MPSNFAKIYLPNLNGIRFIAAFAVIIHHIEQFKELYKLESYWSNPIVFLIGKLGVVLFFVLSGFLITLLLMEEKAHTRTISIKDFYIRRMLRIWPLYYLLILLAFFIIPHLNLASLGDWSSKLPVDFNSKLTLYLLFLPNIAAMLFAPIPYGNQLWSVGVEEQFYLFWPLLVKSSRNIYVTLLLVLLTFLSLKLFVISSRGEFWVYDILYKFTKVFNIDCMAIGGLAAVAFKKNSRILDVLYDTKTQILAYLSVIILLGTGFSRPDNLHFDVYAVIFAIIILNLATNPQSLVNLEYPIFNYLGKISYGLYMFHPLAIGLTLNWLHYLGFLNNFCIYAISLGLSILFSGVSYQYFEKAFLKYKPRFSKIISGDSAKSVTSEEVLSQAGQNIMSNT